jgi:hypothetical protein
MDEFATELAAEALELIDAAFADEPLPAMITDSHQLSDVEYDEMMSFDGMRWRDVTFDQIERNADAVFWFSPEAFRYYLPGFMATGLREGRTDSNAFDAIIGMLDRGDDPYMWDDFFLPRWPSLTAAEIEAVAAWALWLEAMLPDAFFPNTYERVQATLALLRRRAEGA